MKVITENDNNFGYEQITILVDNFPLMLRVYHIMVLRIRRLQSTTLFQWWGVLDTTLYDF